MLASVYRIRGRSHCAEGGVAGALGGLAAVDRAAVPAMLAGEQVGERVARAASHEARASHRGAVVAAVSFGSPPTRPRIRGGFAPIPPGDCLATNRVDTSEDGVWGGAPQIRRVGGWAASSGPRSCWGAVGRGVATRHPSERRVEMPLARPRAGARQLSMRRGTISARPPSISQGYAARVRGMAARSQAARCPAAGRSRTQQDAAGRSRTQQDAAGRSRTQQDAAGRSRTQQDAAGHSRTQ